MKQHDAPITARRMTPEDEPAVLELMRLSLGWKASDPNREFFRWKHVENPFGVSPAWVAESDGEIVGFRTFMRWKFHAPEGTVDAVRAVDTATHPRFRGRGIFTRLTLHALDEMEHDGVTFVFNTPNDQSRPGYIKMGWTPIGRLPIAASISGPVGASRMLRARMPADLWSVPTSIGDNPLDVFIHTSALEALVDESLTRQVVTERTIRFMRWRYGMPSLHYRVITSPDGLSGGALVFRLRRRGRAVEAVVCDLLARSRQGRRKLVRRLLTLTGADYAISLGPARGGLTLYGQGPLLTYRRVAHVEPVPLERWGLVLGDIELF